MPIPLYRQLSNVHHRFHISPGQLNLEFVIKGDPSRETVLLLHSGGMDYRAFLPNIDPLARFYQVVAVSLRGHGLSDPPAPLSAESLSPRALLRDVVSLLWSRGIQQVHFVGHGLGGMLGYLWLQEDPDSLISLTTYGAPARYPRDRWQVNLTQRLNRIRENLSSQKRLADKAARQLSTNEETIAFLREEIFIKTNWEVWDTIREQLPPLDFRPLLRQALLPMLWLEPENDYLLRNPSFRKAMRETRNLIHQQPQSEIMSLPDTGHVAHLDSPQPFNESVISFLTRIQV